MKRGDRFSCRIEEVNTTGKVQFEDGEFYLCQNEKIGKLCGYRYGYDYSWVVGSGTEEALAGNRVTNFKIIPDFKVGDEVKFTRRQDMHWCGGRFQTTSYSVGHVSKIEDVQINMVQLDNSEWYNPEGLEKINETQKEEREEMAKVLTIREDVLKVFVNSEDAVLVTKYMNDTDLGIEGFATTVFLEDNKEDILTEAQRRETAELEMLNNK